MTVQKIGSAVGAGQSPAVDAGKEKFGKVLESAGKPGQRAGHAAPAPSEVSPKPVVDTQRAQGVPRSKHGCPEKVGGVAQARVPQRVETPVGAKSVEADGATLSALIDDLEANHSGIKDRLLDAGELRRFVNVYVNDEDVRFIGGLEATLSDGDQVVILPAVAGGSR